MENQNNNNLSELDQLKAQYETLKQQFDQQEIINDRLMKSSIRHSTDFYKRYRWTQIILYPLAAIIGILCIKCFQGNNLSLSLFWTSYCAVCFAVELWITRNIHTKSLENNDLLTLSTHARTYKKHFSLFIVLYTIPAVILVLGVMFANTSYLPNLGTALVTLGAVLLITLGIAIVEFRYKTRPCDEIIRQIEAAETPANKEMGLNRKQKWFRIAMIVVFIGFDIWACLIVAKYIKTPPMWRFSDYTLEYERGMDNLITEGTLEIRPMDADTVAISSELLGGKPMVQHVEVTVPDKKSDTDLVQINVTLTPEASLLWYQFTTKAKGHHAALYLDGVQIQDWLVQCGINNGGFFIMKERSSKEEIEKFCERLIRQ